MEGPELVLLLTLLTPWEWDIFPPASFVPDGTPAPGPFNAYAFANDLAITADSVVSTSGSRDFSLGDIFAKPLDKALKRLIGMSRFLYVNTFIVSIFSYHMLFFQKNTTQLVTAIRRLVIPFHGAGFSYISMVCAGSLWHVRPVLKDPWAFNVSLLAVSLPLHPFHGQLQYPPPYPSQSVHF